MNANIAVDARMLGQGVGILDDREIETVGAGRRDAGNGMSYIPRCVIACYT